MDIKELKNRFTYHPPILGSSQTIRYEEIRAGALSFAEYLLSVTLESREQSLALTKLDEVVFWSNAAIARNETNVR